MERGWLKRLGMDEQVLENERPKTDKQNSYFS
jgi:hypothetical protein